eukprot:1158771-Pelagomonas_calceolata.AAC.7
MGVFKLGKMEEDSSRESRAILNASSSKLNCGSLNSAHAAKQCIAHHGAKCWSHSAHHVLLVIVPIDRNEGLVMVCSSWCQWLARCRDPLAAPLLPIGGVGEKCCSVSCNSLVALMGNNVCNNVCFLMHILLGMHGGALCPATHKYHLSVFMLLCADFEEERADVRAAGMRGGVVPGRAQTAG